VSRKTRENLPLKFWQAGEQNWVCYKLQRRRFFEVICMGPHTKSEVKTASPTLPTRHATQTHFFLNLTSDIESLGGYLAFPMLEQFINYVVVVEQR